MTLSDDALEKLTTPRKPKAGYQQCLRFFEDYVMPFTGDDCLMWPFARDRKGYGTMTFEKKNAFVHRVACILTHGQPPTAKHQAAHTCGHGRGGCCNPRHVRWATPSENHMDKVRHGTDHRGEKSPVSKLTKEQALEIIDLKGAQSCRVIAEQYGVSPSLVTSLWRGERWGWLGVVKPGPITTRLPGKFARTNAALIAGEVKKAQEQGRGNP